MTVWPLQTYTVEFGRNGEPETAFIVGRVKATGHRFIANDADQQTLHQMSSPMEEQVGKTGYVSTKQTAGGDPERNVFTLGPRPAL